MVDQVIENQKNKVKTAKERSTRPEDREEFVNHPQVTDNVSGHLSEGEPVDRRDISASAADEFGTGGVSAESVKRASRSFFGRLRDLPNTGRNLSGRVDRSAHSNPWMHIGIVGASALFLGYAAGRRFGSSSAPGTFRSLTERIGAESKDTYTAYDE